MQTWIYVFIYYVCFLFPPPNAFNYLNLLAKIIYNICLFTHNFFSFLLLYILYCQHISLWTRVLFPPYTRSTFACVALLAHQQCNQHTPVVLAKAQWHREAAAVRSKSLTSSSRDVDWYDRATPSRYAVCRLLIYAILVLPLPLFLRLFYFDPFFYCFCTSYVHLFLSMVCNVRIFCYCYALH